MEIAASWRWPLADEYDGCFLGLLPYITVVTNVELEHVDIFEDELAADHGEIAYPHRRTTRGLSEHTARPVEGHRVKRKPFEVKSTLIGVESSLVRSVSKQISHSHSPRRRLTIGSAFPTRSGRVSDEIGASFRQASEKEAPIRGSQGDSPPLCKIPATKVSTFTDMVLNSPSDWIFLFLSVTGLNTGIALSGSPICVGARSLLGHRKQVKGSDYYNPAKSSLEPCSDSYRVTTYGISSSNEWHASSLRSNLQGGTDYKLVIATVSALFGDHRHIHESADLVRLHLNNFKGISRRFEMIGSVRGCHIFDDYAHHPTEVRAVIQAARHIFQQKDLLVVFQPHTYSRLAALKNEFATALSDADLVVVTEVEDVVDKLALYICKDPDRETVILTLGAVVAVLSDFVAIRQR
ncbi:hypothetical protein Acr_14g0007520 [Actinidia rufa]|uniref:Mur ligase C-terminal domain-containing protein n=1 Tax=Actinidia rufa TaxID=165716 RepID=A0A7J0FRT1_9ERIC|nr:hypothetical protein Acr_14g0007520 [Actinidia rufa]